QERAAFIHVADLRQNRHTRIGGGDHAPQTPIEKLLFEGQPLLVQVIKDPLGTKGARLSTHISIAGRMLVYLPHEPHIGISQRIGDETERNALRERLLALKPGDEPGGFIVRTQAEDASDEELAADIAYLRTLWANIQTRIRQVPAPSTVYVEPTLTQRVLRD